MSGWIGVDLDGTLAKYEGWRGADKIGQPIAAMVERVKLWREQGIEVRIVTARVCSNQAPHTRRIALQAIEAWCERHLGEKLPVTAEKDFAMLVLYDDRVVRVEPNTGMLL